MTRSARIGLAAILLLGGITFAMAQYPPGTKNPNPYGYYGYNDYSGYYARPSLCAILLILLSNALLRSGLSRPTLRLQGLVLLAIARSAAVKLRLASGSLALFFTIRRNVWNCDR